MLQGTITGMAQQSHTLSASFVSMSLRCIHVDIFATASESFLCLFINNKCFALTVNLRFVCLHYTKANFLKELKRRLYEEAISHCIPTTTEESILT